VPANVQASGQTSAECTKGHCTRVMLEAAPSPLPLSADAALGLSQPGIQHGITRESSAARQSRQHGMPAPGADAAAGG